MALTVRETRSQTEPAETERRLPQLSPRARAWFAAAIREPLLHFFLIGLVLFVAGAAYKRATSVYRIEVTHERVQSLALAYRLQFGESPTPAGLEQLISRWIDEEVLYREGLALGLDKDDEIVRRRIVQKMQFLQQDTQSPPEPSEARIRAFYAANQARYASPARVTFSHVFFSPDQGGDEAARERARRVLADLSDSTPRAPNLGDGFADRYDYADFGPAEASRLFGPGDLTQMLFQAPARRWAGPFRSGYGWHLIFIESRRPPSVPPLSGIHDHVRADVIAEDQAAANHRAFDATKARFTVIRADLARPR